MNPGRLTIFHPTISTRKDNNNRHTWVRGAEKCWFFKRFFSLYSDKIRVCELQQKEKRRSIFSLAVRNGSKELTESACQLQELDARANISGHFLPVPGRLGNETSMQRVDSLIRNKIATKKSFGPFYPGFGRLGKETSKHRVDSLIGNKIVAKKSLVRFTMQQVKIFHNFHH